MTEFRSSSLPRAWMRGWYLYLSDIAIAVVFFLGYLSFIDSPGLATAPAFIGPEWLGVLIATAVSLPITVRRLWPLPAFGVTFVASLLGTFTHLIREPYVAAGLTLYTVALTTSLRHSVPSLGVAVIGSTTSVIVAGEEFGTAVAVVFVVSTLWLFGWAVRGRRARAAGEAEQRTQRAVAEERLRIARELHDIVAHSMSLISVKAAVGNHVAADNPAEGAEALRVIEDASRSALTEMRRMLGALRSETEEDAEREPGKGPTSLDELAERARMAGVEVTMTTSGTDALPQGIGLSVYRIVQEALTNVVKHSAPAACQVEVHGNQERVTIEVKDDGQHSVVTTRGHGLIGMRERVLIYGGEFSAGPRLERGFRVFASLPCKEPS